MLIIRLKRFGKKKKPIYRIVVAPKSAPVNGKYNEAVGFYNPLKKENNIEINKDRIKYWIDNGAKTSDTVNNLLVQIGFYPKSKNIKKTVEKKKKKKEEEKPEKPAVIEVPKSQKVEEGGLLEQAKEEIKEEIQENKAEEAEKVEIAEKIEEAKSEEKTEETPKEENN